MSIVKLVFLIPMLFLIAMEEFWNPERKPKKKWDRFLKDYKDD